MCVYIHIDVSAYKRSVLCSRRETKKLRCSPCPALKPTECHFLQQRKTPFQEEFSLFTIVFSGIIIITRVASSVTARFVDT